VVVPSGPVEAAKVTDTGALNQADLVASVDTTEPEAQAGFLSEASASAGSVVIDDPSVEYTLKRGESLAHFARWSGLPVELIAETSELDLDGSYPVGTELQLPLDPEGRARVEIARTKHHVARADGYLASRGGVAGTDFYTVRTGDSAWAIARDELGIPVWLLETYNPSVDLETLRPGTRLMVPALADTVADAGAPALPASALERPTE
jgi:LysM repeat protein